VNRPIPGCQTKGPGLRSRERTSAASGRQPPGKDFDLYAYLVPEHRSMLGGRCDREPGRDPFTTLRTQRRELAQEVLDEARKGDRGDDQSRAQSCAASSDKSPQWRAKPHLLRSVVAFGSSVQHRCHPGWEDTIDAARDPGDAEERDGVMDGHPGSRLGRICRNDVRDAAYRRPDLTTTPGKLRHGNFGGAGTRLRRTSTRPAASNAARIHPTTSGRKRS